MVYLIPNYLQKTKIPARGLKLSNRGSSRLPRMEEPSKNQNPREGIETGEFTRYLTTNALNVASKNQNPREGIETDERHAQWLMMGKEIASKNQNPREGIETLRDNKALKSDVWCFFKKPKSPRGD